MMQTLDIIYNHVTDHAPVTALVKISCDVDLSLFTSNVGIMWHKGVHQCTWHQDTLGPRPVWPYDRLCCCCLISGRMS
ncbi:hypothetical protein L3Q82_014354 [Scortum barcoo]|uniref:Uncharacterized protein n=1 Tax=Scortum barcoo TaxID=214431 RepID=A0ACB8VWT8_9TELE|nr:hypothetical protein L3Q82_014354 [Scortum barcoo]